MRSRTDGHTSDSRHRPDLGHRRDLRHPLGAIAKALLLATIVAPPAHAEGGGLVLIPDVPLLIALLVGFVLLIFPLNKLIFEPLFAVLDRREERITGARNRAAKLHGEADALLTRYEREVADVRAESEAERMRERNAARAERIRIAEEARGQAQQAVEHSRAELTTALSDARSALRSGTDEIARDIAAQVLGRPLS